MTPRAVAVRGGRLLVDGRPRFLLSGEIHYFRIPRPRWRVVLRLARRSGLDAVSTYVPWRWHEIETRRGLRYDFEGRTVSERDLRGFVRAAEAEGLDVLLRVGPVSNGEMTLEGLPDRLLRIPHAIQSVRSPMHHVTIPGYGEEAYRRECLAWLDVVLPEVVRVQAPAGGPVLLLQLCNEIGMIPWVTQHPIDGPDSRRSFAAFTAARGRLARAFPPVRPGEAPPAASFDRADWVRETYAEYYALLAERARAHGVRIPLVANIPQFWDVDVRGRGWMAPETSTFFERFRDRVPRVVLGGAYQPRRIDAENCHDVPLASEAVRSVQSPSDVAVCAELQTGLLMDRPRLYPADVDLLLRLSAATDLRLLNCYMAAGGENPPGIGQIGPTHDWQAPIGPAGEARPHLASISTFAGAKGVLEPALAEADLVTVLDLLVPRSYYRLEFIRGGEADRIRERRDACLFDGIARLLYLENLPPRWRWIGPSDLPLEADRPAVLFSLRRMERAAQEEAAAFVAAGGRLLLGPEVPVEDERGRPCRVLANRLGIRPVARSRPAAHVARMGGLPLPLLGAYEAVAGRGRIEARAGRDVVGRSGAAGKGRWIFVGLPFSDRYDVYRSVTADLARRLGARPPAVCRTRRGRLAPLMLLLRRGPKGSVLLAAHTHDLAVEAVVDAPGARGLRVRLGRREAALLPLGVRADGVEIVSSEAEVRAVRRRGRRVRIETAAAGARLVVRTGGRVRRVRSGADGAVEVRTGAKA